MPLFSESYSVFNLYLLYALSLSCYSTTLMDDPRRLNEQQRRHAGLPRSLQLTRTPRPHPRVGGTRGYPVPMRESELWSFDHGFPTVASRRSMQRWNTRLHPYIMTGNSEKNVIVGLDQYHMILFLLAWPEARLDEIIAFLANAGNGRVYSRSQVSSRLNELGLTKKVGSTEAKQASLPINIFKREQFWQMPPPFGVSGYERRRLIDVDECGIELQRTNRNYSHTYCGVRMVKSGHYSKDTKLTIILPGACGKIDFCGLGWFHPPPFVLEYKTMSCRGCGCGVCGVALRVQYFFCTPQEIPCITRRKNPPQWCGDSAAVFSTVAVSIALSIVTIDRA